MKRERESFIDIVKRGNIEDVREQIEIFKVDPSENNNKAVRWCSKHGKTDLVHLLRTDPRVDPSDWDNYAIREASGNGHDEVVRLLLSHPRVDPSAKKNAALKLASFYGYIKVMRLLLSDPRVDLSSDDKDVIGRVSKDDYNEVVRLLVFVINPDKDHLCSTAALVLLNKDIPPVFVDSFLKLFRQVKIYE